VEEWDGVYHRQHNFLSVWTELTFLTVNVGQEENIMDLYKNDCIWPNARLHENVKDALWKLVCVSFGAKGLNTADIN